MRSKVIIVRGFADISPQITRAAFERLNADNVLVMTALRYPQYMPDPWNGFSVDTSSIDFHTDEILEYMRNLGHEHVLLAQYAEIATERGLPSIRIVEGDVLQVDWFYETVRNYHKTFGQNVLVVDIEKEGYTSIGYIDGVKFGHKELIDRLGQSNILD